MALNGIFAKLYYVLLFYSLFIYNIILLTYYKASFLHSDLSTFGCRIIRESQIIMVYNIEKKKSYMYNFNKFPILKTVNQLQQDYK